MERLRRQGPLRMAGWVLLGLLLAVPSVVLFLARVRFLVLTAPGRIGHLTVEPDIFVKAQALGSTRPCRGVIVCPPGAAANDCLLDYWRRYVWVVRSRFWDGVFRAFKLFPYVQRDIRQAAINETAPYIAVLRAWGDRPALLALDERHRREARARLADCGVPADAEFVCFHCREGGYSPGDEDLHSFRSNDIANYLPAVAELAKRGLWCIRMGDPSMSRIPAMDRVLDYAHLDARSDRMDVFLCADCRFFIGSASGLMYLSSIFGKPSASANHAPLSTVLAHWRGDVAIPKLLWSEREKRYMNFAEILGSDVGNFRFAALYREHGLRPVENTADDIRDLVLEVLERTEGRAACTPEDEALQSRFRALMRPGHFGYGGLNRVGRDFLRKYAFLLGDIPDSR